LTIGGSLPMDLFQKSNNIPVIAFPSRSTMTINTPSTKTYVSSTASLRRFVTALERATH
jgi:hypothetical protein